MRDCLFVLFQSLAAGLQDFLRYEGDVADAFEQPFCIGVKDVFGSAHTHNLKESGDQIIVTNETRKVCSYDWFCNLRR